MGGKLPALRDFHTGGVTKYRIYRALLWRGQAATGACRTPYGVRTAFPRLPAARRTKGSPKTAHTTRTPPHTPHTNYTTCPLRRYLPAVRRRRCANWWAIDVIAQTPCCFRCELTHRSAHAAAASSGNVYKARPDGVSGIVRTFVWFASSFPTPQT